MKKLIVSAIIICICSLAAFAQNDDKISFSAGPELSFAAGSFSNTHSIGTGGSVQAEYYVMDHLKATATMGVLVYRGTSGPVAKTRNSGQTIIPVRIGGKYSLMGGVYAGLQTGIGFLRGYYKTTSFAYSPLAGYEFKTKSGKSIDATLKYDAYSGSNGTIGAVGFRLAYCF